MLLKLNLFWVIKNYFFYKKKNCQKIKLIKKIKILLMRKLASINPFTGKILKEYNFMGLDEIAKRIEKSKQAFDQYKKLDILDRAEKLHKLADLMEKDKEKFG